MKAIMEDIRFWLLLGLLVGASVVASGQGVCMPGMPCYQGPQQPAQGSSQPSTWCDLIVKVDDNGSYSSTGSGTPVQKVDGGVIVLTNHHVVADRKSDTSVTVYVPNKGSFPGRVLGSDKDIDVAAIFIKADIPCVELSQEVSDNGTFQSRGYAGGKSFRVYHGRIQSAIRYGYFLSSPSYSGMSGGGVFQNNKYVGIIWGGDSGYCAITSIRHIRPFLNRILGRVVVDVETDVVPVAAPPQQPNSPPPSCPDCNDKIAQLVELQADLVIKVQTLEDKVNSIQVEPGPPGPPGPQGPKGEPGKDGKDADNTALIARINQLEADLKKEQERKIKLELYRKNGTELIGVSEGRSILRVNVDELE